MAKERPIKIRERKLGRYGKRSLKGNVHRQVVYGLCWDDNLIEIEPRQTPRGYFFCLIHELIHAAFPDLSERQVIKKSNLIAKALWKANYRKHGQ